MYVKSQTLMRCAHMNHWELVQRTVLSLYGLLSLKAQTLMRHCHATGQTVAPDSSVKIRFVY